MDDTLPLLLRCLFAVLVAVILFLPAWWATGRLPELRAAPFLRLLVAAGAAVVAYLTVVNLAGRVTESSTWPATVWIATNGGVVAAALTHRGRAADTIGELRAAVRGSGLSVIAALVVGAPQWLMAVSTPYWDEVASSAVHITAVYQFSEGLFPPRHDAFPDLPIKYHYAVTILAGTVRWLTGLTPNVSVDVVSTSLWIFIFLFAFHWIVALGGRRPAALAGPLAILLGGGLSWLYVPSIETYADFFFKSGTQLRHRYDPDTGWLANLIDAAKTPVFHLRNADGTVSDLPWDVANHYQQHAVALGIALTLLAAWLLCTYLAREEPAPALLAAAAAVFGLLFLAHAVFGMVAALTAGIVLVGRWILAPSRRRLVEVAAFTAAVSALAFAHGGVLARGPQYGTELATLTFRDHIGYSAGGLSGFLHWNLAAFGVPLVLAVAALVAFARERAATPRPRTIAIAFFATLLLASYLPPQLLYYAYGSAANEEFTEVSKFFFVTHLALGVLAAFGVDALARGWRLGVLAPALATMPIVPFAAIYAASFDRDGAWLGFYRSAHGSAKIALAQQFQGMKRSNRDVFFNAFRETRFLDALQAEGGSSFTVTPLAYERTGGYMIAESLVAERARENGRMARLQPGAEAESGATWFVARPARDFARAPVIARSRFERVVAEGRYVERAREEDMVLYGIEKSTQDLDDGIERWWRPAAVLQTHAGGLAFYDHRRQQLVTGDARAALPASCERDLVQVWTGKFTRDSGAGTLVGRLGDTHYHRGKSITELEDYDPWSWTRADPGTGRWSDARDSWLWDADILLVTDVDGNGLDEVVVFRTTEGRWEREGFGPPLVTPPLDGVDLPLPVVARFHGRGRPDLAVWSASTGDWVVADPAGGLPARFQHGAAGDVLVPGDYDGDGRDEAVVWRRADLTWYGRDVVTGATTRWIFGSPTGVPLPADYNHDGRLDLAYWEPSEHKIFVSFSRGASVDQVIDVPPDSIPTFVNMY